MNTTSRTITGLAMILLGIILIVVAFFEALFVLIYAIPLIIIGIFILFNKGEDKIEGIKKTKSVRRKK